MQSRWTWAAGLLLAALWIALVAVTVGALARAGPSGAITTILHDFGHPWRLQFFLDLEIHLVLIACWVVWLEQRWPVKILCAVATIILGALFTLPYLLFRATRAYRDSRSMVSMAGIPAGDGMIPRAR